MRKIEGINKYFGLQRSMLYLNANRCLSTRVVSDLTKFISSFHPASNILYNIFWTMKLESTKFDLETSIMKTKILLSSSTRSAKIFVSTLK